MPIVAQMKFITSSKGGKQKLKKIFSKKYIPYMVIIGLIAIAGVWLLFFASGNQDSHSSSAKENDQPVFKNVLTPASEIKVGNTRYVSPCQVLPFAKVTEIFGQAAESAYVIEDSLGASVPANSEENVMRTYCNYNLAKSLSIKVSADQYTDSAELKRVSSVFLVKSDRVQAILNTARQHAGNNQDAKDLLNAVQSSLNTYKTYESVYDKDTLSKVDPDGMILPPFASDGVQVILGNVSYRLDTSIRLDKASAEQLAQFKQALDVIRSNAANPRLDQSPINTIIGSTDHIGDTKILEPCALLSGNIFQTITSVESNDLVGRVTLPLNSNRDIIDNSVGKRVIFSNSCERKHEGGDIDVSFRLKLNQAKSVEFAKQYVKDYDDDPSIVPTAVTTGADEAYLFPNSRDPLSPAYLFRVGPYVAVINFESTDSTGSGLKFLPATQKQYIEAVNILTQEIKKQM